MYVVIAGGGRVGSHLASLLLGQGHEVRVIEWRAEALARLHRELPTEIIIQGDTYDPDMLELAGIKQANVLAAVSSDDADNLALASLGRFFYGVRRIIGRVNNPRNAPLFTPEFGVDVALNQADVISRLIEEEMSLGDMMTLLKLRRGEFSLVEEKLPPGSRMLNYTLKDMPLPAKCVIAAVIRKGEILIPRGNMHFEVGDEVLAVAANTCLPDLQRLFGRMPG